jgi:iron complex transport system ATP-binding protein
MTPSVRLQNVSFAYQRHRAVVRDVTCTVQPGTFLAIVGPNGAGKSTLINLIAGFLTPDSGTISLDTVNVHSHRPAELARKIAVVRQEFVPVFGLTVAEAVLMARTVHFGPLGFESQTDREQAVKALELTDTFRFASRPLATLSAGERQRVFIARALAQDTPILLMDEPTSFLDLRHQVAIYDLLKTVQLQGSRTIIAVTHEINLASQYCDEVVLLYPLPEGAPGPTKSPSSPERPHYHAGPPREVLTAQRIEKVFGVRVFSGSVGTGRFFVPLGKMARDATAITPPSPQTATGEGFDHI